MIWVKKNKAGKREKVAKTNLFSVAICLSLFQMIACGTFKNTEQTRTYTDIKASTEIIRETETSQLKQEQETLEKEEPPALEDRPLIVEIDPGHGGHKYGAENDSYGVIEKNLNLQIAFDMKAELETYENVIVYLTREDDSHVELEDRVKKAVYDNADILVSLHNNAEGSICNYYNGCTVLVARGVYNEEQALITQQIGCYFLNELEKLGSANQGLMFRITQDDIYYPNGELCDYYSIVRNASFMGIPGIIVEHGFLDNNEDFALLYSTAEKIKNLGIADARAVAAYYQLVKKDGTYPYERLSNYKTLITEISTDFYQDNRLFERIYFENNN